MYVRCGRRVELGLGGGRDIPLAATRAEAATLRATLVSRQDPKQSRARDDHIATFGECAAAYMEAMQSGWRNPRHAAQGRMTLKTYCEPIRKLPVDEITTEDVLDILQPLGGGVEVRRPGPDNTSKRA